MYLQICTYPRRDLCLRFCPTSSSRRVCVSSAYSYLFFVPSLRSHPLATTGHPDPPAPRILPLPSSRSRTNNQVHRCGAAHISVSFSIAPHFSLSLSGRSRISPFLSTRVCKSLQRLCVLYIRRRMYLHDNIIPFLAYVDWLFFLSLTVLEDVS